MSFILQKNYGQADEDCRHGMFKNGTVFCFENFELFKLSSVSDLIFLYANFKRD